MIFPRVRSTSQRTSRCGQVVSSGKARPDDTAKRRPFATKEAADAALCRMMKSTHGPLADRWTYHDAAGEPVALMLRFNGADGSKEFRTVSLHDGSWFLKGPATPRPLYGLPDVATVATNSDCEVSRCNRDKIGTIDVTRASVDYVCEGEKAADAARSLGLVVVTSMNGALSPDKTDWTPLAGKNAVILPDHDEPGRKYAVAVAAIVAKLSPSPVVKIVELPELTDGDDLVEWIAAHGDAAEPDAMRQELEAVADAVEPPSQNVPSRSSSVLSRSWWRPCPSRCARSLFRERSRSDAMSHSSRCPCWRCSARQLGTLDGSSSNGAGPSRQSCGRSSLATVALARVPRSSWR